MRRPAPRRRPARLIAVAALVAVTGCSALPGSGPVRQGRDIGAAVFPPVRLQFEAPAPGATPAEIVRGFLAASWSADNNYEAARAYLTADAARAWEPRSAVTVYPAPATVVVAPDSPSVIRLTVPAAATVDGEGRYAAAPPGARSTAKLRLVQESSGWRIADLPHDFGLWLSQFYFESAYRPFDVSYADPRQESLVSDRRWFSTSGGLATMLARAQLDPVPAYLQNSVVTGFPIGTRLRLDAVPVTDGVAQIELSREALNATAEERRAAWAQMLATLRQVPGVRSVSLRVDGRPLEIIGVDGAPVTVEQLGHTAAAVGPASIVITRSGDRLAAIPLTEWLTGVERHPRPPLPELPTVPAVWSRLSVSDDGRIVAAVDRNSATLRRWRSTVPSPTVFRASRLTAPSVDPEGRVWVAGVDSGGTQRVWAIDPKDALDRPPAPLAAAWLAGREVLHIRLSPRGRRAVVVTREGDGRLSIGVCGVVLGDDGRPTELNPPWSVGRDITAVRDIAWADDRTLAVIGSVPREGSRVLVVPVGGPTEVLPPVSAPAFVSAFDGPRGLTVVSADGNVVRRVGNAWQPHGRADDVVVPGR